MAQLDVVTLTNGAFAENCYILADSDTRQAVLVDPGEEAQLFLRRIEEEGWDLEAIWLTHAHLDHVMGVAVIVRETNVPVYLHPADRELYDNAVEQGTWLGVRTEKPPAPDHDLGDGDELSVGGVTFEVAHVPGHSPGSVALVGHGVAVVGDALFAGAIGRTDLPGGDTEMLLSSIRERLLTLPDATVVYPGHGPSTTIGEERRSNPFLTGAYKLV